MNARRPGGGDIEVNLGRKLQNVETALMSIGVGGTWTSVKTMTKGVEADRTARIPAVGGFVKDNNEIPKYVTQARAANLLGLPPGEICRLSQEVGVGHMEKAGAKEEWYFTYDELQKIRMHVWFDERGVKTEAWFDY